MKILKVNKKTETEEAKLASRVLLEGGILIYPTDTVYGIGCILEVAPVKKIFQIKKRNIENPLSIACSSLEMAKEYAYLTEEDEVFIDQLPKEEYTFITRKKQRVLPQVSAGKDTVGLRILDSGFIARVIEKTGQAIITTSANLSGDDPPVSVSQIGPQIISQADLTIDNGPCRIGRPSTVIDLKTKQVLRDH